MNIPIHSEYIELNKLLKLIDIAPSGGIAGEMIAEGSIYVDNIQEFRKKRKVYPGMSVRYENQEFFIIEEQK